MLILARRPGERVVIGDEILVTVMAVNGHTVRLGIEAPQGVGVYREEIWLAVKEENRAAAEAGADALPTQASSQDGPEEVGEPAPATRQAEGPAPSVSPPERG